MKNFIACLGLLFISLLSSAQETKENGTIYIRHPYIDVVRKSVAAYIEKDVKTNSTLFSDSARFWLSGMQQPIPIKEAFRLWLKDFDLYDHIKLKQIGYPDYLQYVQDDAKVVQSWWQWSGVSKQTKELLLIDFVQFDNFDSAGKIVLETLFGDFSKMKHE